MVYEKNNDARRQSGTYAKQAGERKGVDKGGFSKSSKPSGKRFASKDGARSNGFNKGKGSGSSFGKGGSFKKGKTFNKDPKPYAKRDGAKAPAENAKFENAEQQSNQQTVVDQVTEEAKHQGVQRERRKRGEGYLGSGAGYVKPKKNAHVTLGRQAACAIGRAVRERNAYVAEVTPGIIKKFPDITPEDTAFATKLARGVTATQGTLDEFINRNMKTPNDIDEVVRDAMRVSAYEMLFLKKPGYVVVDQGVELVCSVAPKAGGLANAVLHRMDKNAGAFPFGNPHLSLQVLARWQAFPMWLAQRLMKEMTLPKATSFMKACNTDAPVCMGVNAVKSNVEHVEEVLDLAGTLVEQSSLAQGCLRLKEGRVLRNASVRELFAQGEALVSDEGAQAVAQLAMPDECPSNYLEVGCGRGTKTILLQSAAKRNFGACVPMTSVDNHEFKTKLLSDRCAAYGIDCVTPLACDARELPSTLTPASFDAVLLDAPCSGVGTLRRHPEIRWRLKQSDISSMASINIDLLSACAEMVAPGGSITYATCTVFEEENMHVVETFLKTKFGEQFEIEKTLETTLTPGGPDAHFACRLRRRKA